MKENGERAPYAFVVNSFASDAVLSEAYATHFRLFAETLLGPLVNGLAKGVWKGEIELDEPARGRSWRRSLTATNLRAAERRILSGRVNVHADFSVSWEDGAGVAYWADAASPIWPREACQLTVTAGPQLYELLDGAFDLQTGIVSLAKAAAVAMRAATGAVGRSDSIEMSPEEWRPGRARVLRECDRYVRGAYWGLLLGPKQLTKLGGVERVLRDAPTFLSEDLSSEHHKLVYLQATEHAESGWQASQELHGFLEPVTRPGDESLWEPLDDFEPQSSPSTEEVDTRAQATFKWEETGQDGEDLGPLIVWDPVTKSVIWESEDWLTESAARRLAQDKGWRFSVDG
jgi:hypothetical protein